MYFTYNKNQIRDKSEQHNFHEDEVFAFYMLYCMLQYKKIVKLSITNYSFTILSILKHKFGSENRYKEKLIFIKIIADHFYRLQHDF